MTNYDICYITDLQVIEDATELATRIYPYGAGNAGARVTLAECTLAMPSGYTLSVANNYIVNTAAETAYGRIDARVEFKDIGATDGTGVRDTNISNALGRAALTWLRQHIAPYKGYALSVMGLKREAKVGETLRVQYREYRDGLAALNIDEHLLILAATTRFTPDGVETVALEVAPTTQPRYPMSDRQLVAKQIETLARHSGVAQGIHGKQVR